MVEAFACHNEDPVQFLTWVHYVKSILIVPCIDMAGILLTVTEANPTHSCTSTKLLAVPLIFPISIYDTCTPPV